MIALLALLACGTPDDGLTVAAAASLTDVLQDVDARDDVDLRLTFAASHALQVQIEHGLPADVFASAHPDPVSELVDAGLARDPAILAYNELVLVVPAANPAGLASLVDLPRARRIVVGTAESPIGGYTTELLDAATARYGDDWRHGVTAGTVSHEANVRLVLSKVALGEADAAIVYRTDAVGRPEVAIVDLPPGLAPRPAYMVAPLVGSARPAEADALVELLVAGEGRAILERHGFAPP